MTETLELMMEYVRTQGLFTLRGCEFRFQMYPTPRPDSRPTHYPDSRQKLQTKSMTQYIGFVCSSRGKGRIDIGKYVFPDDLEGSECVRSDFVDSYDFDPDDLMSFTQTIDYLESLYGQITNLACPVVKQRVRAGECALIVTYPPKKHRSPQRIHGSHEF